MKKKMKLRLCLIVLLMIVSASVFAASAFFTDISSFAAIGLKTASIGFGYPEDKRPGPILEDTEYSIIADLGEHNERLTPYEEGDVIELCFYTCISGSVPGIVVPRLEVISEGLGAEGRLSVSVSEDGEADELLGMVEGQEGSSFFYGPLSKAEPGEEKAYRYTISIDRLSEGDVPILDFDFSVCVVQLKDNEELLDGETPKDVYDSIYESQNADETGGSEPPDKDPGEIEAEGFSGYADLSDAVESDGQPAEGSHSRRVAMELSAAIEELGSDTETVSWYQVIEGERRLICDAYIGEPITVLINERTAQYGICYELKGRAGSICSDIYVFDYNDGSPVINKLMD